MIRGYEVERLHLVNIAPEQLEDKIFKEALELTIEYEIDEEEYMQFCAGTIGYEVDPTTLTVTLDTDAQVLTVTNNDFSRTSDFGLSMRVVKEESEFFGAVYV